jgi:LPPG:FO 2-phospho-L-lactate transferase
MSRDLVVAFSGGIGGAKLALGLSRILPADNLLVVANVGDDFEHLGLHISPDADTLMYTLAGLDNTKLGWGRQDETWSFMETLTALGGEGWFRLGDRDLAVHVERTRRLRRGETLSSITADFCRRLGIGPRVLPATDDPVRTRLRTDEGWLDFQDYFVRLQCRPAVRELAFEGAEAARPHTAGDASGTFSLCGACHCGFSHHRRPRGQGADSQNDGGAGNNAERRCGRGALRRSARRLCDGHRRR